MRFIFLTVSFGLALCSAGLAATVDQWQMQCENMNDWGDGTSQSFTAGRSDSLTAVKLQVRRRGGPRDLTVEIRRADATHLPVGPVLASGTLPGSAFVPEATGWYTVPLDTPFDQQEGELLAFTVRYGPPDPWYGWLELGYSTQNPYAGGLLVYSEGNLDFAFQTLVGDGPGVSVTFDGQGGTVPVPQTKSVPYNGAYGELAAATRVGYTLTGWFTGVNGTGSQVTSSSTVEIAADHELYAMWAANAYNVTFDAQGGSAPNPPTKSVTYGSAYGTLATTARTGYTFEGWWTPEAVNGHVTEGYTVRTAADHTLIALWAANAYTVTFDAQGGTADPQDKTVTYNVSYGTLPVPVRVGYAFGGWWTGADGTGAQVTEETNVTVAAAQTLYAAWREEPNVSGMAYARPLPDAFVGAAKVVVKGLPAGLKYNAKTGMIEGVPAKTGSYNVTVSATGVAPQSFTIYVEALPAWAQGVFNGYVDGGGAATMTVTAQGKVTGKVAMAGTNYAFSAASYAAGGSAEVGFEVVATAKSGKAALPLTLRVRQAATPQTLGAASGLLGTESTVVLYRDAWKDAAAKLAPLIGYYTATLPGEDEQYGSGYLTFTVDKAGKVKVGGKLADGTAVSLGGTLILDESGQVWAAVYTAPATYRGGHFFMLAEFVSPEAGKTFLRADDGGTWVNWNPTATGDYGDGFNYWPGLVGGWYDKLINLRGYYGGGLTIGDTELPALPVAVKYTDLDDNDRKVSWTEAETADAAWDASPEGLSLVLNAAGTGFVAPKADKPVKDADTDEYDYAADTNGDGVSNTGGLTFTFTRATGIFKGSFLAWYDYTSAEDYTKDTEKFAHTSKAVVFEGVLTPERGDTDDGVAGRGFFLWPDKGLNPATAKPYGFNGSYEFLLLSE